MRGLNPLGVFMGSLIVALVLSVCFLMVCIGLRMIGVMREDIRKLHSTEFIHSAIMKLGEEVTDLKATCIGIYRHVKVEETEFK